MINSCVLVRASLLLSLVGVVSGFSVAPLNVGSMRLSLRGGSSVTSPKMIAVGETLPAGELFIREDGKTNTYTMEQLFGGKRSVVFAVPGAFTPTCSEQHLPSFVKLCGEMKEAGADVVACVSVNDPFVMREWGIAQKVGDVKMLADGAGKFSEGIGMLVDKGGAMGKRCNRFAMVLDKSMKVEYFAVEKGGYGETSGENVLAYLQKK